MIWACLAQIVLQWTGDNEEEIRSYIENYNGGTYTSSIGQSGEILLQGSDPVYTNYVFPLNTFIMSGSSAFTPEQFAERCIVVSN